MTEFRSLARALTIPLVTLAPGTAFAHVGEGGTASLDDLPHAWGFDPLIWALTAIAAALWFRGLWIRRRTPIGLWRAMAFPAGLAAVFVALQSPVDAVASHLYRMHQIQHGLLRMIGPLLMLAAVPHATISAGVPRRMRKGLVSWAAGSNVLRATGRLLTRPVTATALFILVAWFWQIPPMHNASVLNEALHYVMHVTMLVGGILFFWVLLDPRDAPKGAPHGRRAVMLAVAFLAQIVLGALMTMKPMVLYPAYDILGRMPGIAPLTDEIAGGFIQWAPSCMMFLPALFLVVYHWNGLEERRWARMSRSNSAALAMPQTAEEMWMAVRAKNARLGLSLAMIPVALILAVYGVIETIEVMA